MSSEPKAQLHSATQTADPANPLVAAEYKALRDEILARLGVRYQLLNLTLISAGTLLGAGLSAKSAPFLLVYPILGLFLAAGWAHNGDAIVQMARYIRDELEVTHPGLGWETYLEAHPDWHFAYRGRGVYYAAGIFLTTQLIALTLGLLTELSTINIQAQTAAPNDNLSQILIYAPTVVLIVADFIAILLTVVVLRITRDVQRKANLHV